MQLKTLSLFIALTLAACQTNKTFDIVGSWTSTNVKDNTGINVTDKIDFKADGSYNLTMYSNGDSVISELRGLYEIDNNMKTITIITNGISFQHEIIEIENEKLKIKTSQGVELTMRRIE